VQVGGDTGQGILTDYSDRVSNIVAVSLSRQLTGKTSLNTSGSYSTTQFLDSPTTSGTASGAGLDNGSVTGGGGLSHLVDARNTFGGNYAYSDFSYSGNTFGIATQGFISQTASGMYSHKFTRKVAMSVSAGPQWSTASGGSSGTATSLFADASLTYSGKSTGAGIAFVRSTNGGYGAVGGALSSSVSATVSRRFAAVWAVSANSSFTQSSALPLGNATPYSLKTYVEGLQVSRAIVRNLSGYVSYNLADQSISNVPSVDLFSGLTQSFTFGITYSPSALHLGRQ